MLRQRLILGPIMVLAAVLVVWLDVIIERHTQRVGIAFGSLIAVLITMACWELARILRANNVLVVTPVAVYSGLVGLLGTAFWADEPRALGTLAVLVMILSLLVHVRHKTIQGVMAAAGGVMLIFVYLGVQGSFWLMLRIEHSAWLVLWLVLVTKSCDIGAYFTGRAIGRHKLIPWLSPGKTWEGLIGGLFTSMLIAILGYWLLKFAPDRPSISWGIVALMGLVMGGLGQLGDLTASLFKRDAGKKDSSNSLPGFGGWLDVLDSLLLVGPFAFWTLRALTTQETL